MGYTKQVISGFSWQTALRILSAGLSLIKIIVVARILSPTDFGLFSLIAIALGLVEATTQTGINVTILQSKQSLSYFIDTAWVIAIFRGLAIGTLVVILGLFMGRYYQEPQLPLLAGLAALVPVIKGFINPGIISLRKELRFFSESLYYFSLAIVEMLLAIALVWWWRSVTGLVIALVGGAFFEVFISFTLFPLRPKFAYMASRAKVIFGNAKGLGLNALLFYINENSDNFILGKILGTHNLGLYHNAYTLGHKPNFELAKAAHHGLLPVLTKFTDDTKRLRRAVLRSNLTTSGIVFLTSLPLFLIPELVVKIILGEQWLSIVPAVPWLGLAGILQSISMTAYSALTAVKQYFLMNVHLFISIVLMVALLYILAPRSGVEGAAQAIALSRIISTPLILYGLYKTFFASQS